MDLLAVFSALPAPSSAGGYSVEEIGANCRIGKSADGFPAILVSLPTRDGSGLQRRLANLVYTPPSVVEVRAKKKSERAELAIVECRVNERHLVRYFFRIVTEVIAPEAALGSERRFEAAIDAVVTLFKSLSSPASRTVQGLWAELAMIAASEQTQKAFSSWHSNPRALHDFVNGGFKLEVKSSSKKLREHSFLLDQLTNASPNQILIASLYVTEHEGGISIHELVKVIGSKLSTPEARNRLRTIVADALGADIESADQQFDLEGAILSLQLYRAEDVPKPAEWPAEVTQISFTSNLSNAPIYALEDARTFAKQFAEILPLP